MSLIRPSSPGNPDCLYIYHDSAATDPARSITCLCGIGEDRFRSHAEMLVHLWADHAGDHVPQFVVDGIQAPCPFCDGEGGEVAW